MGGADTASATGSGVLAPELLYVALLFILFVLPRALLRFKIPTAVTSVVLGAIAGVGFGLFDHDETLRLLSTLGIVALFLFAGLGVDELRRSRSTLGWHLLVGTAALGGATVVGVLLLGLNPRVAALIALALLTPSTGFILDSLATLDVDEGEKYWIQAKAIASELLALLLLFVVLQSTTWQRFGLASVALAALILVLPIALKLFAEHVVPFAPKSEFAFLLMLAVVAAYAMRQLGVYYLVGAFIVGLIARRYRDPWMRSVPSRCCSRSRSSPRSLYPSTSSRPGWGCSDRISAWPGWAWA